MRPRSRTPPQDPLDQFTAFVSSTINSISSSVTSIISDLVDTEGDELSTTAETDSNSQLPPASATSSQTAPPSHQPNLTASPLTASMKPSAPPDEPTSSSHCHQSTGKRKLIVTQRKEANGTTTTTVEVLNKQQKTEFLYSSCGPFTVTASPSLGLFQVTNPRNTPKPPTEPPGSGIKPAG